MEYRSDSTSELIRKVTKWAQSCDGIVALALAGSHVRWQAGSDSDIDFILLCDDTSSSW